MIQTGSWKILVNIVNNFFLFYFILFCLFEKWECETKKYDDWPSKGSPLKTMRVVVNKGTKGDTRRKREGK
jgi:hypothetical protein